MDKIIVFQGDSITDCGRSRDSEISKGHGYAVMIAGALGADAPGKYTFYNRGVSGNRIVDLYARIKFSMINLKPDYMSILVGVNDVWHEYNSKNGVSTEKYEMVYGLLIEELKQALPELKIMILEPFVLPGGETRNTPEHPDRWDYMDREVRDHAAAAKRVAQKYGLKFIPLQAMFDEVDAKTPGIWTWDGVHPTPCGHELIKRQWLAAFLEL